MWVISISGVAICWLVWVALVGGVTGCSVVQWWGVLWAVGLLCWGGVGVPLGGWRVRWSVVDWEGWCVGGCVVGSGFDV